MTGALCAITGCFGADNRASY